MKRLTLFLGYGAAVLTILFALALPIKLFPVFLSVIGALDLKIAPQFSGGEVAFVIDRGSHQIKVYHPVYPALFGQGSKGFVQLVWEPRSALPSQVQDSIDLNRDGTVDCEISFSNPASEEAAPVLTVDPKSPWVFPAHNSPTISLEGPLIERVRDTMFVRIPIRKMGSS
ncbi:MAG: hypothetical protein ABSF48_07075 [Thermodesulfobacteriota bacterium]|jgi:hypothetical protein